MEEEAAKRDLDFLVELNKRCCKIDIWTDWKYRKSWKLKVDSYDRDVKLAEEEIKHVFDAVKKNSDLVAYPTCSMFGHHTTIRVYDLKRKKELLSFAHTQLPDGYTQERLIPYLREPKNKRKVSLLGWDIEKMIEDHIPWFY